MTDTVVNMDSIRQSLTPEDLLTAVKSISTKQLVQQIDTVYKFVLPDHTPSIYYMDLKHGNSRPLLYLLYIILWS